MHRNLLVVIAIIGLALSPSHAFAFSGGGSGNSGKPGQTGTDQGCGRVGCHNPEANYSGSVQLIGPTTVLSGQTYSYTLRLNTASLTPTKAGLNIANEPGNSDCDNQAPDKGVFILTDAITRFVETVAPNAPSCELTHQSPRAMATSGSQKTVSWSFDWRAPVVNEQTIVRFFARGLAADGDTLTSNDDAVLLNANGVAVTVVPTAAVTSIITDYLLFDDFPLTVIKAGTGAGTVTSNLAGIDCGVDCGQPYAEGSVVQLTAAPSPGSVFGGWSGDCAGAALTAAVTLDGPRQCYAHFDPPGQGGVILNDSFE